MGSQTPLASLGLQQLELQPILFNGYCLFTRGKMTFFSWVSISCMKKQVLTELFPIKPQQTGIWIFHFSYEKNSSNWLMSMRIFPFFPPKSPQSHLAVHMAQWLTICSLLPALLAHCGFRFGLLAGRFAQWFLVLPFATLPGLFAGWCHCTGKILIC